MWCEIGVQIHSFECRYPVVSPTVVESVAAFISSLFLFTAENSISLCEYTTILLYIYLLVDIYICSFGLL